MNEIVILLDSERTAFRPGETVSGQVQWECEGTPKRIEISLFWYTAGKGTRDVGVIDRVTLEEPAPSGVRPFQLELSNGPYSFSGKLISLIWAVEAKSTRPSAFARQEITVSPTGREILLQSGSAPAEQEPQP